MTDPRTGSQIIDSFETKELKKRPVSVWIIDFLSSYFGTVAFLSLNLAFYGVWVIINLGKIPGIPVFDPYPFSFLNSLVSIEAIFLTIIVLMSQNRQNQRDVIRNEMELQVELIAEREITKILRLLKESLGQKVKHDGELEEMTKEIDASYIERKLEEQLEASENPKN